jgi:hypothetical protein
MGKLVKKSRFTELNTLKNIQGYSELKDVFTAGGFTVHGNKVDSKRLYVFLNDSGVEDEYLENSKGTFLIDRDFAQLILIDLLLVEKLKNAGIDELSEQLKGISKTYKPLLQWNDCGIVIAYLHEFKLRMWRKYVLEATLEWNTINALDKAMSLIQVGVEDLVVFLEKVQALEAFQGSVHKVSQTIAEKLKNEPELAADFEAKLDEIIHNEKLRKFIAPIIIGISSKDSKQFQTILSRIKDNYEDKVLFDLFWGFLRCCPVEKRTELESLMHDKLIAGKLSKPQYLQLSGQFKTVSSSIAELLTEPMATDDFVGIYEYLYDLADSQSREDWYRSAAIALYTIDDQEHKWQLDFLLYNLSGHNLELVYELLTTRFEQLGSSVFLGEHLDHIIDLDRELFKLNLTQWLNSESRNVHKALLKICSGRNSADVTKVSTQYFKTLSAGDKVYICFKIAGFIYSMEHLQNLLFSVLDAAEVGDEPLLTNLYSIFRDYLVYNYRSTLDQIKERLDYDKCSELHRQFLQPIVDDFEHYFTQLNTIRMYNELRADSRLEEFLGFYKSQLFASSMNKENKTGFMSMMKPVTLYAKKWAIRRVGEKVHQVAPLSLIQHSIEFPSGEKLDPTYHEALRRNYQRIQKHEINFS